MKERNDLFAEWLSVFWLFLYIPKNIIQDVLFFLLEICICSKLQQVGMFST